MIDITKYLLDDLSIKALNQGKKGIGSLNNTQEALILASSFKQANRNYIVVKPTVYQATNLSQAIENLGIIKPILFTVEESLQVEAIASSPELEAYRIESLIQLINSNTPQLIITHTAGLLRYLPSATTFKQQMIFLKKGEIIKPELLKKQLRSNGYRLVDRVEQPLTYSCRGEVIDVFSLQNDQPVRIEFFDDEIDSIREFSVTDQLTVKDIADFIIAPATDLLFTDQDYQVIYPKVLNQLKEDSKKLTNDDKLVLEDNIKQDLSYLQEHVKENYLYRYYQFLDNTYDITDYVENPYIILSPNNQIDNHYRMMLEENVAYIQDLYAEHKALLKFNLFQDYYYLTTHKDTYEISELLDLKNPIRTSITPADFPSLPLATAIKQITKLSKDNIVILSLDTSQIKQVIEALMTQQVPYKMVTKTLPKTNGIYILLAEIMEGFRYPPAHLVVLTAYELFNVKFRFGKYTDKFRQAQVLNDYDDLAPGDFVVHNQHGIGRYLGIVTKEFNGIHTDYLNIAYRGDVVLLVPLEQFKLVRKFIGSEGVVPKLSKLGTNEWKKTKEKLQEDVDKIAEKLLELYTTREQDIGFAFQPDTKLQVEFEKQFAYELTTDQKNAIKEIKQDMEQPKPMDRLLCGDVGFGKTEVAIQAAFKAVVDHKQIAVLCPTTILSRQHYYTFTTRFSGYPVNIAILNRFVEPAVQKEILKQIKNGQIDIVIGTHRLLSADVTFKDLGLLVIDEEQRFGVENKERIKVMKKGIDVLSLSATPIPRTLQMSLIGVRSLSQLNTPPNQRMPVQTYVIEKNNSVIRDVIQRELGRGGQVFYLFNNILQIYEVADRIAKLVPGSKVAVAHGKMDRDEIEDVMLRFTDNEYNVLVCTTIIENGIDIPNANTMIVDRADTFGLAQLYQIKGRVGRSNRVAYAYLMYNGKKQLSETASKRLTSIKDFTQLGSGYKIAMRDLSIRGAGDLLGSRQAGFINTVGMDMYVSMLQDAVLQHKGLVLPKDEEVVPRSRIGVDGYIPMKFANKDYEKIHLYQRIDQANTEHDLQKLEKEVIDRYGHNPASVSLLFEKRRMEILSNNPKVQQIKENAQSVDLVFTKEWCDNVDGVRLFELVSKISIDIKMRYQKGNIILSLPKTNEWLITLNQILEKIKKL